MVKKEQVSQVPIKKKDKVLQVPIEEEAVDVKRLVNAGKRTDDPLTLNAGVMRASKLAKRLKVDITNPVFAKITGLDKLTKVKKD